MCYLHFKCKCKGSEDVKIVTAMGCRKGGLPLCKDVYEIYCKDGTQLTSNYAMTWKINGGTGCGCKDGIMPRYAIHSATVHDLSEIVKQSNHLLNS
jgi:hypothetical protein